MKKLKIFKTQVKICFKTQILLNCCYLVCLNRDAVPANESDVTIVVAGSVDVRNSLR